MKTLTKLIVPLLLGALAACGDKPTPPAPGTGPVTVSPKSITVKAGESTAFSASVEGTQEPKLLWSVEGEASGTITSTGVYTAPAQAGTFTVVATNALDTTKKDTAEVTVTPAVLITLSPALPTVGTGGRVTFTAQVTGATDASVTWSIQEGDAGGTITREGVYTAPATSGVYTVIATSVEDPSRKGTTQVNVDAVALTVSPNGNTVDQGEQVRFSAHVSGAADPAVTWSVEGGDAHGTITEAGLYTAPAAEGTYTLTATSKADTTKKGSASINVRAVSVSISPASQSLSARGSVTFHATVTGTTASKAVTWSVAGDDTHGTITAEGVYTAPDAAGTFTVIATSVADPTKKAEAQVTVTTVSVQVSPGTATSQPGATTTFTATVTGSANPAVTWSVEGEGSGTITSAGVYTAPSRPGTFTVVATSVVDPTKKGTATVTVPAAQAGGYTNPPDTDGWRLVKNTSASSGNHVVLDLLGPTGQSGHGVALTLSVDAARADWAKVSSSDTEYVTNGLFSLGDEPRLFKGAAKDGTLRVGVFQKGKSGPATEYTGALLSVAVDVKLDPSLPAGTRIPLSVVKAQALTATGDLRNLDIAVGVLATE